ncbi:MAG: hypothetical protein K6F37_00035, partial [Lachnospiraceae bacterium]|nr:hypothetical protein [Lachnospiraceae bacterium]
MKWKYVIALLYIIGAVAAGGIYTATNERTVSASENKEAESITDDSLSSDAADNFYKKQLDDALEQLSEAEQEKSTMEAKLESLSEENKALLEEITTAKAEKNDAAEDGDSDSENDSEAEENSDDKDTSDKDSESDIDAEDLASTGEYEYTYTVNTGSSPLNLYSAEHGGSPVGKIPKGTTGYVVEVGEASVNRALILYDGKTYYASKSFLI